MYTNRMLYILIGLALAAVIFFTFREAVSTAAIAQADRSYDQVEQARLHRLYAQMRTEASYGEVETIRLDRSAGVQDPSYDRLETLRVQRDAAFVDRSYDAIERLRAARGTQ